MCKDIPITRRKFISIAGLLVPAAALACREQINIPFITTSQTETTAKPTEISGEAHATVESSGEPGAETVPEEDVKTPEQAFQRLFEGNQRFMNGKRKYPNQTERRRGDLTAGQKPFATILGCVDSRVPPEIIFDRGLGDLFVIRTAGQVLDDAALGSIEFGVEELKIPLLMVLGHEKCGAVKATIETLEKNGTAPDKIQFLVDKIKPSVELAKGLPGDLITNTIIYNVLMAVEYLKSVPLLEEFVKEGKLKIVGARYNLGLGTVDILSMD